MERELPMNIASFGFTQIVTFYYLHAITILAIYVSFIFLFVATPIVWVMW